MQPSVAGSRRPPRREAELRAWIDDPVERRESDVGPDRCPSVGASLPDHFVDDLCDPQAPEHLPHRSHIAEGEVAGAIGHHRRTVDRCLDVGRLAQVALGDDPGLAAHPGRLDQVVVGVSADRLGDDGSHTLGNTPSGDKSRASDQGKRAGQRVFWKKVSGRAEITSTA